MDKVRSTLAEAPPLIPLLVPSGPANRGGNAPLSHVTRWEDLPNHLFIGEIEPRRFARTSTGWEAEYFGVPDDTALKIIYRAATTDEPGLTKLGMYYRGVCVPVACYTGDDVHELVQYAFPKGMPPEWYTPVGDALAHRYNMCVITADESDKFVAYSPSGIIFDVIVPVPVSKLRDCAATLRHIQADAQRMAPAHAALRHVTSVVRHKDRSDSGLGSPASQFLGAWHATGLKPPQLSEWKTEADGTCTLHVTRAHYVLEVRCFLIDMEHIAGFLAKAGILGMRAEERGLAMADSSDYPAVARLFRPDRIACGSAVFDDPPGRTVDYVAPLHPDLWVTGQVSAADAEASIAQVMEYVRACEDFERATCAEEKSLEAEIAAAAIDGNQRADVQVELDEESQPLGDAAIEALGDEPFLVDHPSLGAFQEWCDETGFFDGVNEVVCCGDYSLYAPDQREIIDRAVDSFEGEPTVSRILGHIRETWEWLTGDYEEWGLERPYRIAAPLRHSNGTLRTLGFVFSNFYSPIECDGIFADREAYDSWLASQGLIAREQDLDRIELHDVLGRWGQR